MPISTVCSCGKTLKIPDRYAGKRVKCPACGGVVTAPVGDSASAKSADGSRPPPGQITKKSAAPPPRPLPELEPFEDDDDLDEPPIARRSKKAKKTKKASLLPLILAACGVLVAIASGVGAWLLLGRSSGGGADLTYVPADAQGFAAVRVADIWKTSIAQSIVRELAKEQIDPNAELEKVLGIGVGDVERVTAVLNDADRQQFWWIVATSKPVDKGRVLEKIGADAKETQYQGKAYHVSSTVGKPGVHFANDRLFVLAEEGALKACLEKTPRKDNNGKLAKLIGAVGHQHVVLGGAFPQDKMQMLRQTLPPMAAPFAPLLEARTLLLIASVGEMSVTDITVAFADDAKSKAAKEAVDSALGVAKGFLGMAKGGQGPPEQQQAIAAAEEALKSLKVEQRGAELRLAMSQTINSKQITDSLAPALGKVRSAATRTQGSNNLKQIALAMHNYHGTRNALPPAAVYDKEGKRPLYSWRVELLPFLEEQQLYEEFHKNEPWDSEHNRTLLSRMPKVFVVPGKESEKTKTHYQVFTGPDAPFPGVKGKTFIDFTDGTSNTILVAEAANAVNWTEPVDIPFEKSSRGFPLNKLGATPGADFQVALADGSVRTLTRRLSPSTLQAAITLAGGEVLGPDW